MNLDDTLEIVRIALGLGIAAANVAVWYGVWLERDSVPIEVQHKGWRILVRGLAAETALGLFLFAVDTTLGVRQRGEIDSARGAAVTAVSAADIANKAATKLQTALRLNDTAQRALESETKILRDGVSSASKQISDLRQKEDTLRGNLGTLQAGETALRGVIAKDESEVAELEDEYIGRVMAVDETKSAKALKPYADVPIFLSAAADPDSGRIGRMTQGMLTAGMGKPAIVISHSNVGDGIHIFWNQLPHGPSKDLEELKRLWHEPDHRVAAATAICRELRADGLNDVKVQELVFVKGRVDFFWDDKIPITGVLIRVGAAARPLFERKVDKVIGIEAAIEETKKRQAEGDKIFGPEDPCTGQRVSPH